MPNGVLSEPPRHVQCFYDSSRLLYCCFVLTGCESTRCIHSFFGNIYMYTDVVLAWPNISLRKTNNVSVPYGDIYHATFRCVWFRSIPDLYISLWEYVYSYICLWECECELNFLLHFPHLMGLSLVIVIVVAFCFLFLCKLNLVNVFYSFRCSYASSYLICVALKSHGQVVKCYFLT